jgi:hypothetical protein
MKGCLMSLSDALMLIQTLIIVAGFVLAYQQFSRWRDEIVHDRRVDLAMKIGEATYRFQHGFRLARDSFGRYKEGFTNPQGTWTDLVREGGVPHEEIEYDRKIRLEKVFTPITELRSLIWQTALIFTPDNKASMDTLLKEFEALYWTFADAIYDRDMGIPFIYGRDEAKNIVGSPGAKNPETFERKIEDTVKRMQETITQITIGHDTTRKYDAGQDWRTKI